MHIFPAEIRGKHVLNSWLTSCALVTPYLGRFWTDLNGLWLKLKLSTRRNEVFIVCATKVNDGVVVSLESTFSLLCIDPLRLRGSSWAVMHSCRISLRRNKNIDAYCMIWSACMANSTSRLQFRLGPLVELQGWLGKKYKAEKVNCWACRGVRIYLALVWQK